MKPQIIVEAKIVAANTPAMLIARYTSQLRQEVARRMLNSFEQARAPRFCSVHIFNVETPHGERDLRVVAIITEDKPDKQAQDNFIRELFTASK